MTTPFIWFDHRSDAPSAAATFYETLLGWARPKSAPAGMTAFGDEKPWSGMVASEGIPAGWLPYAKVDDLDAAVQRAESLGASVVKARTRGPAGDFVVLTDPAGANIALWQAPAGA